MNSGSAQPPKYRFIAPRTASDSSTERKSGISTTDKPSKAKRAPVACMECRKHRTKCSTELPCLECATHKRECIYDHSADKRRKEHVERREQQFKDQLDKCQQLMTRLLDFIRYEDDYQVQCLINVIRGTDRLEDIEAFISSLSVTKSMPESQTPEAQFGGHDSTEGDRDLVDGVHDFFLR